MNPTTEINTDHSLHQINSFNKDFYKESSYNKKTVNDTKSTPEKVRMITYTHINVFVVVDTINKSLIKAQK